MINPPQSRIAHSGEGKRQILTIHIPKDLGHSTNSRKGTLKTIWQPGALEPECVRENPQRTVLVNRDYPSIFYAKDLIMDHKTAEKDYAALNVSRNILLNHVRNCMINLPSAAIVEVIIPRISRGVHTISMHLKYPNHTVITPQNIQYSFHLLDKTSKL